MDLKVDLTNKVQNELFFTSLELSRLAQDVNMNYQHKIDEMSFQLERIALLNAKLGLVEQYFTPPADQDAPAVVQPQQGQTHAE
jgi:hypothetical protein